MVKNFKIIYIIFLLCAICLLAGCTVDLLGLFGSNDLAERLKEKDRLAFINAQEALLDISGGIYSFAVLADIHMIGGNSDGLIENLKSLADNENIKFAVILGDITQNGAKEDIDTFFNIVDALNTPPYSLPVFPVIGNHDVYFGNWKNWRDSIGTTNYRIDSGTTTLLMLDSANSFFGKEQLDWLERQVKTTGVNENFFVFTHTPLFVVGPVSMQQGTDIRERARIISVLQGNCDIMFMGHLHRQLYNEAGSVRYIGVADYVKSKEYCLVKVDSGKVSFEQLKF